MNENFATRITRVANPEALLLMKKIALNWLVATKDSDDHENYEMRLITSHDGDR